MVLTRTTVVGKKDFAARPGKRSCCSPLPGRKARLDVIGFSRFAEPAPVRGFDIHSHRSIGRFAPKLKEAGWR
jgi:hypothetical protein